MPYKDPERRKAFHAKWNDRTRVTRWAVEVKRRYKISPETFFRLLALQEGGCAVCGKLYETGGPGRRTRDGNRNLSIDHDHKTGKIRGILCSRCNTALGLAEDSIDRLLALINYLRNPTIDRLERT